MASNRALEAMDEAEVIAYIKSGQADSGVMRATSGRILRGPSLPCGCPLDSGCDSQHVSAS